MALLRVDEEQFNTLLKKMKTDSVKVARQIDMDPDTVRAIRDEAYPLLSQFADRVGVNPIILVKVDFAQDPPLMMVDTARFMQAVVDAGVSRDAIAEEFGVHRNTMHNLSRYRFNKLSRIAGAMGVSPMSLLRVQP